MQCLHCLGLRAYQRKLTPTYEAAQQFETFLHEAMAVEHYLPMVSGRRTVTRRPTWETTENRSGCYSGGNIGGKGVHILIPQLAVVPTTVLVSQFLFEKKTFSF